MSDPSKQTMPATAYHESEMTSAVEAGKIGSRAVSIFSARSPLKETPNEDSAAFLPWDDQKAVLAVADGVGGASLGEVASRTAIEALIAALAKADRQKAQLRTVILDGIEAANRAVLDLGAGAATTLAVVEVATGGAEGDLARTYHVGDAGVLIAGGRGRIKLLTTAHSPVGYGLESGLLDEFEAMHHAERHVVSNVIGSIDSRIEIGAPIAIAAQDSILVASDGLFDNLTIGEIVEMTRRGSAIEIADRLATAAGERMVTREGGVPSKPDDLTLLVVR